MYKIIGQFVIIIFCIMLTLVFIQIFSRYVLNRPIIWIEELAQFLLIYVIFIGSISAHKEGQHAAVTVVLSKVPRKYRIIMLIFSDIVICTLLVLISIYGVKLLYSIRMVKSAALDIPYMYIYASFPLGAIFMFVIQISTIKKRLTR